MFHIPRGVDDGHLIKSFTLKDFDGSGACDILQDSHGELLGKDGHRLAEPPKPVLTLGHRATASVYHSEARNDESG